MLKVMVKSQDVRTRTTSNGNEIRLQKMALQNGDDFPVVFEQYVETPWPPGEYEFVPQFRVSRYGGLELHPFEFDLRALKA
jgi:hypothetical protein